jgi:hypothetical protein
LAHPAHRLDAVFVDRNGVVKVMWVINGGVWQGSVELTPPDPAPSVAPVTCIINVAGFSQELSQRALDEVVC